MNNYSFLENSLSKRYPIQDVARTTDVSRWHSVPSHRRQTVAEHQHMVSMFSRELLLRIMPGAKMQDRLLLQEYASFHDVVEGVTGDVPTPFKRYFERFFPDGESPLDALEHKICPEYTELKKCISGTPLERIAKLADILDAIKFIREEGKHQGNLHESVTELRSSMISAVEALMEDDPVARKNALTNVLEGLNKANELEKEDPINRIIIERKAAYKAKVESSKLDFPNLNWGEAFKVMDEVLHGLHMQIDFTDR